MEVWRVAIATAGVIREEFEARMSEGKAVTAVDVRRVRGPLEPDSLGWPISPRRG
jgi:hypothetical protein